MGAGKTTIGRVLARKLNIEFFDLDWYIEARFRMKINQIFEQKGEAEFRKIESLMLHEVGEMEDVVISCGGGTPCFFDNMEFINKQAESFYLKAKPEVIKTHLLMAKTQRPLLKGLTPDQLTEFITKGIEEREKFYLKAKHIIDINVMHTKEQIQHYADIIYDMVI